MENILNSFKQLFNDYQEDNGTWKSGVKGDIVSLNDRVIELEQSYQGLSCEIRDLQEKMRDVITSIRIKYPHRCPVCEGKVKILIDPSTPLSGFEAAFGQRDANGIYYRNCMSCEGSGIVWG